MLQSPVKHVSSYLVRICALENPILVEDAISNSVLPFVVTLWEFSHFYFVNPQHHPCNTNETRKKDFNEHHEFEVLLLQFFCENNSIIFTIFRVFKSFIKSFIQPPSPQQKNWRKKVEFTDQRSWIIEKFNQVFEIHTVTFTLLLEIRSIKFRYIIEPKVK